MNLIISLEEILTIGSVACAILIALGITFCNVDALAGGTIVVSLCGGTVIAKILREKKSKLKRKRC